MRAAIGKTLVFYLKQATVFRIKKDFCCSLLDGTVGEHPQHHNEKKALDL